MILAVLDANVIVSAILTGTGPPGQVLEAWRAERFSLLTAPAILDEIERVLKYPKIAARHRLPADRIRAS